MEKSLEDQSDRTLDRLDSSIRFGFWINLTLGLVAVLCTIVILAAIVSEITGDLRFVVAADFFCFVVALVFQIFALVRINKEKQKGGES